ncbi:MAG: hypothetical protein Q9182_004479 [Xanthomendoza sp. 2 TL-2023]
MYFQNLVATSTLIGMLAYTPTGGASVLYRRPALFNAELALQIQQKINGTNTAIPGGSPFFYMEDPANHVFAITSISMSPTPCQIGLPCSIEARGTFRQDLPSIDLDFDIEARLKNGQSAKLIAVRDNLCQWATMKQPGGSAKCPPRTGPAMLQTSMDLARGWIPEVSSSIFWGFPLDELTETRQGTFFVDLKLLSGTRVLTHLGAQITLTDADPNPPGRNTATA